MNQAVSEGGPLRGMKEVFGKKGIKNLGGAMNSVFIAAGVFNYLLRCFCKGI